MIPIYSVRTIISIMSGHFKIPKAQRESVKCIIDEVRDGIEHPVSNKYIALSIQQKLPKKYIYDTSVIKLIITGQYK